MSGEWKMKGLSIAAAFFAMGACATIQPAEPIKPGDKVGVDFTCRLANGEIAATTDKAIASDKRVKKATIFQARKSDEPLVITAGPDEKIYGKRGSRGFEGEIVAEAAEAVVGMRPGETRHMEIRRERNKPMGNEPMVLEMARIRTRAKEVRMTPAEYKGRTGKDPEVGQSYTMDPAVPGKVESVSDQQVVIRFHAEPGKKVKTPLGEGEIRETGKDYEIVINAKQGDLVRSGGMVGRIVEVGERMITIDYGHPLGYEELKCEVTAQSIEQRD
jgi:FKBP-type peptidyl-prolyl cis-trans isomerase 2